MPPSTPTLSPKLRRRLGLVTSILAAILLGHTPAPAGAEAFLPAGGQIFQGVAGQPISQYEQAVGKHPAVYQIFSAWGQYLPAIFQDATDAHARLMLHITTGSGPQEMITPAGIARGDGDSWLIALGGAIYASGHPTYVRLMAEMDNAANPYSAYNANGSSRGAAHSPTAYKNAWRRVTLILRGGPLTSINAQLHAMGMPALRTSSDLPQPQVAMMWVPMTAGSPDMAGNEPSDYWPGRQWVDWVGTDFYSAYPNFRGLNAFYNAYPGLPFVFGEWALWGSDDTGFVGELFGWVQSHPRTRMLIYNQGVNPVGPFRLSRYPASARALRRLLGGPQFPAYAPDWTPGGAATPAAAGTPGPAPAVSPSPSAGASAAGSKASAARRAAAARKAAARKRHRARRRRRPLHGRHRHLIRP